MTIQQIEATITDVQSALTYLKEARHVANRVHGDPKEVSFDLKIALSDLRDAVERIEQRWLD